MYMRGGYKGGRWEEEEGMKEEDGKRGRVRVCVSGSTHSLHEDLYVLGGVIIGTPV